MLPDTTYSRARASLASIFNQVIETRDVIFVRRRHSEDVAILPASELTSLKETVYLFRSPANAKRLLEALADAKKGKGKRLTDTDLKILRKKALSR